MQETGDAVQEVHRAAASNDASALRKALSWKKTVTFTIDVNDAFNGTDVLHRACISGNSEIVGILIDAGASMSHLDTDGNTCLHVAKLFIFLTQPLLQQHCC